MKQVGKSKDSVFILRPENLDLEAIVKKHPPGFDFKMDVAYYFVWHVLKAFYTNANDYKKYTNLCSKYLRPFAKKSYQHYLKYFASKNVGVLERGYVVWKNGDCTPYRLQDEYEYEPLVEYEVKDKILIKNIQKESKIDPNVTEDYSHLTQYLLSPRLHINPWGALRRAEEDYYELAKNDMARTGYRKYMFRMISLLNLKNGYHWIARNPESDRRLHSNLTNLSSELRPFLTYDGDMLVGIDLKNSQPFFLYFLLTLFRRGINEVYRCLNSIEYSNRGDIDCITLVKMAKSAQVIQWELYEKHVLEGTLYEYLASKIEEELDGKEIELVTYKTYNYLGRNGNMRTASVPTYHETIRDFVKTSIFGLYYGSVTSTKNKLLRKVFRQEFGDLYDVINLIKAKDKNVLSKLMQNLEAYVFLDCITKRIHDAHQIPLFTIHDSIATTEPNAELLLCEIQNHMYDITGLKPTFKTEPWSTRVIDLGLDDIDCLLDVA